MSLWSDMEGEMQPLPLDPDTADRLLAGSVAPEDAPPGYGAVVRLLDAASAEPSAEELAREGDEVGAMVAAVRLSAPSVSTSRRSIMPFAPSRPRLAIAGLAAAFVATAGMASAGSLPGAAQDVASDMLAKLGISVPGPNENAGDNPNVRGKSGSAPSTPDTGKGSEISELATTTELTGVEKGAAISGAASGGKSQAGEQDGNGSNAGTGKGSEISELATTTDLTGVDKGAAISSAASDGQSQAGQHGSGASGSNGSPPVATPNSGGTGTADTASGGASSQGTSTANAASGGASAAGAANAGNAPQTAPAPSGNAGGPGSGNGANAQGPPASGGSGPGAGGNAGPPQQQP
jgi:hypothetical protein